MNNLYLKLYAKCQNLLSSEEGQDLVEYALLVALLSVAAVAFLPNLASAVSTTFTNIEKDL
jgi:pilus assembly protein Flp/PilA